MKDELGEVVDWVEGGGGLNGQVQYRDGADHRLQLRRALPIPASTLRPPCAFRLSAAIHMDRCINAVVDYCAQHCEA